MGFFWEAIVFFGGGGLFVADGMRLALSLFLGMFFFFETGFLLEWFSVLVVFGVGSGVGGVVC